MNLYFKATELL